ncbi:MAG: hypothetical protein J6B75_05640 [Ruminococcus sp.]|nr:hypothetical protein [Ruminococcus sp.]
MGFILLIVAVIIVASILESIVNKSKSKKEKIRYIEGLNLNETLSQQIKAYIKTGMISSDYFYVGDMSEYIYLDNEISDRNIAINRYLRDLGEVILFYKKKLLENINNGTDYHTKYGVIREVYLGKIEECHFWGLEIAKSASMTISSWDVTDGYGQNCYYVKALTDYGFVVDRHQDNREYQTHDNYISNIYAYIKM